MTAIVNVFDDHDYAEAAGQLLAERIEARHLKDEAAVSPICRRLRVALSDREPERRSWPRRLHQTMADYVVIAISPALIMTLVGSLVFFLLNVFYQGQFAGRLHWVMACFVFAAVLIGRISIEEGFERAMPFGIALAIAVGIAVDEVRRAARQLGRLVRLADQLGLDRADLVVRPSADLGLHRDRRRRRTPPARDCCKPPAWSGPTEAKRPKRPCSTNSGWKARPRAEVPSRLVAALRRTAAPAARAGRVGRLLFAGRAAAVRHRPVVHPGRATSAAAAMPSGCCASTSASGLGLLLTTSFLGLRRYLRQRRIEMPHADGQPLAGHRRRP